MSCSVFLCADIGTSSLKGALFFFSGECLAFAREELPAPGSAGAGNAEEWLAAFRRLVARLLSAPNAASAKIEGIVVSGNGPTLVPVGADGKPVFSALLWMDGREESLAAEKSLFLPKAAWLSRKKPEVYEKTAFFLGCPEYLAFRLTGERHAFSPSEEFSAFIWAPAGAAAYGLEAGKFPPALATAGEAGRVSAAAAAEFGLPQGARLYAAAPDFLMALLGTAAVRPGLVCDRAGTSEGINVCAARPVSLPGLRCLPHVIEGLWNVSRLLPPTGLIFEWFRGASGQKESSYAEIFGGIAECEKTLRRAPHPKENLLFFPKNGESGKAGAGVFVKNGRGFSLEEALAGNGKDKVGLAVAYGIGFTARAAFAKLTDSLGPMDEAGLCGGQAKNAAWNRLKARLTGKTLRVPEPADAELVGCLAAGLRGRGEYRSLSQAAESLVRFTAGYEPGAGEYYDELYALWQAQRIKNGE
ncbi:MAG: FGGY-family carbohydrate kinase [Spirochaetaceae bacterium]|nr:FGGY-family carbohydrate kinase [Spirochaetaceae bacterium]